MAKMTLLQLVQNILSDLNSDEVNSISDTVESTQVAEVIKSVYYDLINDNTLPEHFNLAQLTALGDTSQPNYMQLPTDVMNVKWIKYDHHTTADTTIDYRLVNYVCPEEFLNKILSRDSSADNIDTITDDSGVYLLIQNDKMPEYYTSFDDDYLVFDSYDSGEQTTLTAIRSMIYCSKEPVFSLTNTYVPDIDANLFPLLLAESKRLCFINNTQSANPVIEQIAKRHQSRKQSRLHRLTDAARNEWPNFGRRR